jgi:hypothetical protein
MTLFWIGKISFLIALSSPLWIVLIMLISTGLKKTPLKKHECVLNGKITGLPQANCCECGKMTPYHPNYYSSTMHK